MPNSLTLFVSALSFILPCWLANGSLNLLYPLKQHWSRLEHLDKPFDLGLHLGKYRLLGSSTTWLGWPVALLVGLAAGCLISKPGLGLLQGACVYCGHALGSFLKRRLGMSGAQFLPLVDHFDYIWFTGFVFYVLHLAPWPIILLAVGLNTVIHPLVTYLAYRLNLRKYPY